MIRRLSDFKGSFAWRYNAYLAPYRTLYRDPWWYSKYLASNARAYLSGKPLAYVYADPTNAGDYVSHLGVRMLADVPGVQVFCSQVSRTFVSGAKHRFRGALIGGGGLLQPCFEGFWRSLLASQLPFALFGVGENVLPPVRERLDPNLIKDLAKSAKSIHVRDESTRDTFAKAGRSDVTVGLCPSVNYLTSKCCVRSQVSPSTLLHIIHESDLRFSGVNLEHLRRHIKTIASQLGLIYREIDHCRGFNRNLVRRYARAACIISSRLHGCIFSYALARPFLAVTCDSKTRAFVETHCPEADTLSPINVLETLTVSAVRHVMDSPVQEVNTQGLVANEMRMQQILKLL